MKRLFLQCATFCLGLCFASIAMAAPATTESVEKLLALTQTEKLTATIFQNMDGMMKSTMNQAVPQPVKPETKQAMDQMRASMIAIMKDELSWEKMKPLYVQVYQESFTQQEIDGLIDFYQSPTGQAFVEKMPAVMQKTSVLMQARMAPIMQRMQSDFKKITDAANAKTAPAQKN